MNRVKRAYKYRFYPTPEQERQLARTFGCVRYVYNWALGLRSEAYAERGEKLSYADTSAQLTVLKQDPGHAWLGEVSCVPLQQALRHLQAAFGNFLAGRARYPVFRSRRGRQRAEYTRSAFRWDGEQLWLAKQAEPLAIVWSRRFRGQPSTVTVSRDPAGRYFVSLLVEEAIAPKPMVAKAVGVDLGISEVLVTSEGFRSGAPKYLHRYERQLARRQRRLARKCPRSRNWHKARLQVARLHARIGDCRRDFTHKLTTRLVHENQVIAVETLAVTNLLKHATLAKAIAEAGWGELLRQLAYKCAWYGRRLIGIDRWYPSSKRCSGCGVVREALSLAVRAWRCTVCGARHDRDVNAARNILAAGLAVIACGERVSLVPSPGISGAR